MTKSLPQRGRFEGMVKIARYNWPFYAVALAALLFGGAMTNRLPRSIRVVARVGLGLAAFWTAASLLVSHWVYDRSPLYQWNWLRDWFPQPPRRWANIHCGLDETSLAIRALFPDTHGTTLDIYDARIMTEASIARARTNEPPVPTMIAEYSGLPLDDGECDAIFLIFAAHELREAAAREQFFLELHRVLSDGGRVLLVEHLRDTANFAAFGPGFWHFLPRGEWRRLAEYSALKIIREETMTPFVRIFLLEKS